MRNPWRFGTLTAVLLALVATDLGAGRGAAKLSAPWADGDDGRVERFLLEAEIVSVQDIGRGVTRPRRVSLLHEGQRRDAVWKDVRVEYARWHSAAVRRDTLYFSDRWQHEIAAYRVDRLLGLGLIPVTVERRVLRRRGSLQAWVDGAFSERDRYEKRLARPDPARFDRDAARMVAFDALIYNSDRTQENILVSASDGRLWLIDHSRSFSLRPSLPPLPRRREARLPGALREALRRLDRATLDAALGGLLSKGQIRAVLKRRDRLLEWPDAE